MSEARAAQTAAAKALSTAISKYLVSVRSTASAKKIARITLEVTKSITALQDSQVLVEKLKGELQGSAKHLQADAAKVKASIADKLKGLEQRIKPRTQDQNHDSVAEDLKSLNMTGPGSRVVEMTAKVNSSRIQVNNAQDYLNEVSRQLNDTTKELKNTVFNKPEDRGRLLGKQKKIQKKVLTAKAQLKVAIHRKEDSEMAQMAEKEAMKTILDVQKKVAAGPKGRSDAENLDVAAQKLATAALAGDASAMKHILDESMVNHTQALQQAPKVDQVQQLDASLAQASNSTHQVANNTHQAANDTQTQGFTRQEYQEERLAQQTSQIKDKVIQDELAETIAKIDEPSQEGLTKQQFDAFMKKQHNQESKVFKSDVTQLSDDKEGMSREAFKASQKMLSNSDVASLDFSSDAKVDMLV